jgi:hypothetical protein
MRYTSCYYFFLVFLFFIQRGFAQRDTIFIHGVQFITLRQAEKTEYDIKDTLLKFYRLENGNVKYLFSHYLCRYGADCNNEFRDIGTIQVRHDSIILKTHYLQKRNDPIPEWRRRIYKVDNEGKLLLLYDKYRQKDSKKWTEDK